MLIRNAADSCEPLADVKYSLCSMIRRALWASLLAGSILSLLVSVGMGTQSLALGSLEGHWVYRYIQPFAFRSIAVCAVVAAMVFALCAVPARIARCRPWWMVVAWLLVGFISQAMLRSLTPFTLTQIFVSDGANSFYGPTRQYSAATLLTEFDELRPSLPLHAQSNLPGKLVFVSGLRHISRRPTVMAWLIIAISDLGGVLMFVFVRDLFDDSQVALSALILYLFVPATLFFFPLLNTVTPVLVLLVACLLTRWLKTRNSAYAGLVGVSLYGLIFFEPLPLVMGLLFAGLVGRALWRADIGWRTCLRHAAVAVFAFGAIYTWFVKMFRFDLFASLLRARIDAAAFNVATERPYGIWVWQNLLDFAFGTGVCQVVVFCVVLAIVSRSPASPRQVCRPIAVVCFGLAAVLLATDLLGVSRGEVVRLWVFLACFFQIPAAYACARLQSRAALMLVLGTTLLQTALGTAMVSFIVP
jgi:hypothetical protein